MLSQVDKNVFIMFAKADKNKVFIKQLLMQQFATSAQCMSVIKVFLHEYEVFFVKTEKKSHNLDYLVCLFQRKCLRFTHDIILHKIQTNLYSNTGAD